MDMTFQYVSTGVCINKTFYSSFSEFRFVLFLRQDERAGIISLTYTKFEMRDKLKFSNYSKARADSVSRQFNSTTK